MIDNQSLKLFGSTVNVATSQERNWRDTLRKAAKVLSVCYCAVVMLSLLLPDAFVLCLSEEEALTNSGGWHAVLRTALAACFVVLPLSAFYKNKTLNNCCFVVIVVAVIAAVEYPTFMSYFTDPRGRGINSMSVINDNVKAFLLRKDFRTVVFFASVALMLSAAICSLIAYGEKHDLKDKEEYMFLWVFPLIMLLALPIYVPQHIIGYTDMIFKPFSLAHFLWITATVGEIAVLYVILRRKDTQTQNIVLLALSLALLLQFNQLFGAVSISFKRLPLQLCNIGSFLILASLISKNKKIFNFTLIINVAGALFAYAVPDVDGKGIGYLYNMHFILEHTGVVVIPLLCLLLGFIDKTDGSVMYRNEEVLMVSLDKAKEIALADAEIPKGVEVVFTKEILSRNSGRPCWILEFYTEKYQFSYKVDAKTGGVIFSRRYIYIERAREIALKDAGVEGVDRVEFTVEELVDGGIKTPYYLFRFNNGSTQWTYRIDATDGGIQFTDKEELK